MEETGKRKNVIIYTYDPNTGMITDCECLVNDELKTPKKFEPRKVEAK